MTRIAINGFGRIGRLLIRRLCELQNDTVEIVAINDISNFEDLLYLLKYDSTHGRFSEKFSVENSILKVQQHSIKLLSEPDVAALPWQELDVDVVIDCSGHCRNRETAQCHLDAGAKKLLVSAPLKSADITLVLGVNDKDYDSRQHHIISNASCTTNSLAPPLKVLSDSFGIESVLATTIHAYTISQSLVDNVAGSQIRGRAGAINIIPTSTGSDIATVQVLPKLENRISVVALRVPVVDGSITDINVKVDAQVTVSDINSAFEAAAREGMSTILEYSDENLVSSDIIGNSHSAIIHAKSTRVINGNFVKIQAWYDNEYGYTSRLLDTVKLIDRFV